MDSNLGTGDEDTGSPYTWYVQDAVDEGLLEYDENGGGISNPVDAAMNRTLFLRFALGRRVHRVPCRHALHAAQPTRRRKLARWRRLHRLCR